MFVIIFPYLPGSDSAIFPGVSVVVPDDFYVSYQLNVYTKEADMQAGIYSDLHQNIQDKFNEAGVEIMSPHYRTERDGSEIVIPPDYKKK